MKTRRRFRRFPLPRWRENRSAWRLRNGRSAPPFPRDALFKAADADTGRGCKRGTDAAHLEDCFRAFLHENGVSPLSVRAVATIDVKKDEAAILALCEKYRFPLQTYSAAELNAVPGVFAHSDFVMKTVGCGCVCERAAVMTGGRLLVAKRRCRA